MAIGRETEIIRAKCDAAGMRNVRIGYFLHTPFPSSEIFRILPVRREILQGLLKSDLIAFHTFDCACLNLGSFVAICNLLIVKGCFLGLQL